MGKSTKATDISKRTKPATTPEEEENECINLAMREAKKQLLEGTASSQVITHFLKLGSSNERLEKRFKEKQVELMEAKTEAIKSAKNMEALYLDAIKAMRGYSGSDNEEEEDDYDDYDD